MIFLPQTPPTKRSVCESQLYSTNKLKISYTQDSNWYFSFSPLMLQPNSWWLLSGMVILLAILIVYASKRPVQPLENLNTQKNEMDKLKAISYQYNLEIEQVINYFSNSISAKKNAEDILWDVAKDCISKLGFEDCVIYLIDEETQTLVQKAAWGPKTTEQNKIVNPIEIPLGKGIAGFVALNGKAEIVNDTSMDKRYLIDDAHRASEITVPIIQEGKVIGIIDSENPKKDFYTQRHLQILTTIASLCAGKIDKAMTRQQSQEKEIELSRLHKDLAASQLTALRAQMNPHFIFNALNSVQQYILQGNVDEANKYLSMFSKLLREVINQCEQEFILLEKEIEMLTLYLQLEQLRFDNNFSYNISFSDEIDPSEIKIPPLLLQPFTENAIWHGLLPKEGNKKVDIDFLLQKDNLMICTIKDNGIGRKSAEKLKAGNSINYHDGLASLSLITERLRILQQQYQQPFEINITDITDLNGTVKGTQVKLSVFIA